MSILKRALERHEQDDGLSACRACGITWNGKEIPDELMDSGRYATRREAEEAAEDYGWTSTNKRCFKINMVGIEDPEKYDGVSYWRCTSCGATWDRFTGELLDVLEAS